MSLTWRLLLAHARQQKTRLVLTALAMIAAVGVVLWVVSAYEAVASQFDERMEAFVGDYTAFVVPKHREDAISEELIAALGTAPAIETTNPVTQFRMPFRRVGPPLEAASGRGRGKRRRRPTIVGTQSNEPRYPLTDGRWLRAGATEEAVVSSGVADALSLRLGDSIGFRTETNGTVTLEIVGVVDQVEGVEFAMTRTKGGAPGGVNRGPASFAAYVPLKVVEKLSGQPAKFNLVEVRLKPGATIDQLAETVRSAPEAELLRPKDIHAKLASGFQAERARKRAVFVTALSILASAFIIFTTLSMGVSERARQLAVLRAVGLRRSQVACLVLAEAIVLAVFGWLGGLAGGWALLQILARAAPEVFPDGVTLGSMSVVLTGACSLLGALLASIFPIWKATHISPLEAMARVETRRRGARGYALVGLVSLAFVAFNPMIVYLLDVPETLRLALILSIGVPTTVLGFIFLAPLAVLAVERIFTPVVAGLFRLQPGLVQTQLSSQMWRSAGIAASLMLGLGLYTATQVWGQSMLGGYLPGHWTPDVIVKFEPGLPEDAITRICQTSGVDSESCLSVAVEQAKLVGDPLQSRARDSAVRQDNAVVVGLDAKRAFEGDEPLFQAKFIQGDRADALAKLHQGRFCLVPETFLTHAGLGVGDRVGLMPPKRPGPPVEYTIAGVVAMTGSNWITKTSGMRRHFVRTAGLVFAPQAQVREDFDLPRHEFFWLDTERGVTTAELEQQLRPLVAATPEPSREEALKVTSIAQVRDRLLSRGGGAVRAMGWLPLITLVVVSLGIVNTIAASVRARQWEFGILRAIGLKRLALTRLILSEALLIGLVASVLSLAFGVLTGWTCLGLVGYVGSSWFAGVKTPLVIPWSELIFGYALTFVLCFIAALWPAVSAGRREPLSLLQAGRAC